MDKDNEARHKVRLADIAEKLGVSIVTVSKAIADKESVQVTDEDVDKLIGDDAKASGQKVEDYRARISDRDMEYYREDARTRKTIDLIKEAAKVEVKDADERIKAADAAKAVESVAAAAEALEESDPDKE